MKVDWDYSEKPHESQNDRRTHFTTVFQDDKGNHIKIRQYLFELMVWIAGGQGDRCGGSLRQFVGRMERSKWGSSPCTVQGWRIAREVGETNRYLKLDSNAVFNCDVRFENSVNVLQVPVGIGHDVRHPCPFYRIEVRHPQYQPLYLAVEVGKRI